jgi:hypothetical protein
MSNKFNEAGKTGNQMKNDQEALPNFAVGSSADEQPYKSLAAPGNEAISPDVDAEMNEWLSMSRDAYRISEDYFDASIRKSQERNLSHFNNKHAPGSKYYSEQYKFRSKGFRPKTRSVIRRNEAKAAIALFSTVDVISIKAENDIDKAQGVSAEVCQELVQYRLENTIPWYQLCIGAYQDSLVSGVCISHQFWDYQEVDEVEPLSGDDGEDIYDNETGEIATGTRKVVIKDTPRVELRPVENIRFSPAADWDDPVNTSPYFIDKLPMTIGDIKTRAKQSSKTKIKWFDLDELQLRAGGTTESYDPIRSVREGNRQDSKDQQHLHSDFDTVWVHRNIIQKEGIDWIYYTLGTHYLLSKPIPLMKEYPHLSPGERPYKMGTSMIETHKTYPESLAGMSSTLNQEANDINNQRRDNVQLVLNKRYYARRGANIDTRSLVKNAPGSVTEMDDIDRDIRSESPLDVTGSAYQEQDRINLDFDELTGAFSASSIGTNRQLNETVGGMELLSGTADDITEFQLRTFVTTWVKPVLKQLVQLEQRFETDEALLQLMGDKLELWQRFGVDKLTDRMIQGNMTVSVNVGFGATNPKQRIEKFVLGIKAVVGLSPKMGSRIDGDEVAKEIFGAMGFDGADRFFPPIDPNNPPEQPKDPRVQIEEMRTQVKQMEIQHKEKMEGAKLQQAEKLLVGQLQHASSESELGRQQQIALETLKAKLEQMSQMSNAEMNTADNKVKLAEVVMKLRSMERQANADRGAVVETTEPPYEPAGRAKDGQSYSH